ncbi:aspartate/glutamate racemase family protein [Herbiconiux sp. 11R-BC]|uniref:aspartate/glutamate racemase family protein n=1 Tax=Herbiconiux sp. 11R-BC TaxID=3111637 RepID=UPI003C036427
MTISAADRPLVALISAVPTAIPPAVAALAGEFPAARVWNLLDDRLLDEVTERGGLTPELAERMARLVRHAVAEGADGILVTCSRYGDVVHDLVPQTAVPLLASDDAAFGAVLGSGLRSVLLISPAAGPLADSLERLTAAAASAGIELDITGAVAEGSPAAAAAGDAAALVDILAGAYRSAAGGGTRFDAVLLGQYSLSPAGAALAERIGVPVLTTPVRAAIALREQIDAGATATAGGRDRNGEAP